MKLNTIILITLVVILLGVLLGNAVQSTQSQGCDPFVYFGLSPSHHLEATALCGDTPAGQVDFYADGVWIQHFSIPPLSVGQTISLPLIISLADVASWEIVGTWNKVYPPPTITPFPTSVVTTPTIAMPPSYVPPPPGAYGPNTASNTQPLSPTVEPVSEVRHINTVAQRINVRRGPGVSYAIIGSLEYGATVTITGQSGGWYQISFAGDVGWIFAPLTSAQPPECLATHTWWGRLRCRLS